MVKVKFNKGTELNIRQYNNIHDLFVEGKHKSLLEVQQELVSWITKSPEDFKAFFKTKP